ncbi:MAG: hypothetical protein IKC71_04250 [Clostridia bacterium]|nr:hypothetical protein [Clostridia bacterium]
MKIKLKSVISIAVSLVLIAGAFLGGYFLRKSEEKEDIYDWIESIVGTYYALYDEETGEYVEFTKEDYARAMVSGLLDKYSFFFNASELEEESETKKGNHYGLGVSFWKGGTTLEIARVLGNSPAEKAGITDGELITAIKEEGKEKVFLDRTNYSSILTKIEEGVEFTLYTKKLGVDKEYKIAKRVYVQSYVWYYDSEKQLTFTSNFGEKPIATIESTTKNLGLDDKTAYIEFASFSGNADEEMIAVMDYMHERGKTKLILDLRNNGGGYLSILEDLACCFIKGETAENLVAYSKYKDGTIEEYKTTENRYKDMEVVVLANKNTASASECLIGAMLCSGSLKEENIVCEKQEDGRATTYGKGIMQRLYVSEEFNAGIQLTVGHMFWPNGVTIHKKGITPTVEENKVAPKVDIDYALERGIAILKG